MHLARTFRATGNQYESSSDHQSNASSNVPLLSVKHGAHIHVRPRHQLSNIPEDDHHTEAKKILRRISEKQIEFEDNKITPSKASESVLENIGRCLQDYFELEFMVIGHVGTKEAHHKSDEDIHHLGQNRAEECMKKIYQLADASYLQVMGQGTSAGYEKGTVTFEPLNSKLLGVQERMNLVTQRCGWDFAPGSADITERGRRTADLMSRVLQGGPKSRVVITVPRSVTNLAARRSEAIARALRETRVPMDVVLRTGNLREERATVTIEDLGFDPENPSKDPHEQILDILRETPLAFLPNSAEIAPDVLPVLTRCARVLRTVDDKTCVVEAYSGKVKRGNDEARTLSIMVARAQAIVDHLKAEGVRIPCRAEGFAGPYPMAPESKRPCVVITLDDETEDDEVITESEDPSDAACCW